MVGLGTYSLYAFAIAPRKVTIPAIVNNSSGSTSQGVELLNGSANPVTYKVTCYDKAGTTVFGPTNHTLTAKQKAVHGATPLCTNGNTGFTGKFTGSMLGCGSTYNNGSVGDPLLCPVDFHQCSFSEMQANSGEDHSPTLAAVSSGFTFSVTGDWSTGSSSNSSMTYMNQTFSYGFPAPVADSNSYCYSGSNGNGTSQSHCMVGYSWSNKQTLCCPNSGAERTAHSCDVEVVDPTTSGGFLQSPQFKGSSPF